MSERGTGLLALAVAAVCAAGCAGGPADRYIENRRQDLIDVAHVDLSAINIGAVAYAGPFLVGADYLTGMEHDDQATVLQNGLGGPRAVRRHGLAAGLIWPAARWNPDRDIVGPRPKRAPNNASFGVAAGLILGVGVEADPFELLDFLLGLFGIDLAEDDTAAADAEPAPGPEPEEPEE